MKILYSLLLLFVIISNANAKWYSGIYVGAGLGKVDSGKTEFKAKGSDGYYYDDDVYNIDVSRIKFSPNVFFGYNIIKYFGVEAFYEKALKEDNITIYDAALNPDGTREDNMQRYGVNLVGRLPIKDMFVPFIKFGVAQTKYNQSYHFHDMWEEPGVWHDGEADYKGVTYIYTAGYEQAFTAHHSLMVSYNYEVMNNLKIDYISTGYTFNYHGRLEETSINLQYKYTF